MASHAAMTSQSVLEDLGAQSPSIAKGGERDRERSIVQIFSQEVYGRAEVRCSLSRAISRAGRREEVIMLAKVATSHSQPLNQMAFDLDHNQFICPMRYRSACRSSSAFPEHGLKVVGKQSSSLKTTKSADDRVWCVAARDACLAASFNSRRPAPRLLLAGIDRNKGYEQVFELYLRKHISYAACKVGTIARFIAFRHKLFSKTILQYLSGKSG